ncbi:C-C motif chemokine 25b [Carassius carassius]|uniref:C-C motif chemokine 25b n=1 Tax=Carassius carassius TaxID=217509 RepID=UPI002869567D|nr:C-C motif chemokine 25b [Carassius carassius]XP_059393211.1 C-C motif chemokine 25b [Carassius carassius]XP_059393212.1 C-C motif chemokine 25b [Carassius carassius]XP_059393213.1 C-C motif chemokine 25b [Carassius carassius]
METKQSTMKFQILFFLLLLACVHPSVAQGSYENCCLQYAHVRRNLNKYILSFRVQKTDGGCNIPAVVLKLKNFREICVDPRIKWVNQMIQKRSENNTGKI